MADSSSVERSLDLYHYLCQNVVRTEETVKTKRMLNAVRDNVSEECGFSLITSGSFGEGLEMAGSDIDFMFVLKHYNVYENIEQLNFWVAKTCFIMDIENTKPGFTQLRLVCGNEKILQMCKKVGNAFYLSNRLFRAPFLSKDTSVVHGPCLSDENGLYDYAYCLFTRSWVSPAGQWLKRSHTSWPSREIKSKIVEHGVIFVPIGMKGSQNEELEWRLSFSVGEKLLINTFRHTQLLCYALMKILLKVLNRKDKKCKDLLCSYFVKNIMLWISEEIPSTDWNPENLIPSFLRCFRRLIYCVEYSICPHYFIPENNMFENKIEGDERELLLNHLYTLYGYGWQCLLTSKELAEFRLSNIITENHSQSFQDYVEQFIRSKVVLVNPAYQTDQKLAFKMMCSHRSSKINLMYLLNISTSYYGAVQQIPIKNENGNKITYKQYRTCLCYLLQSLYHDVVSGWLMMASFFYQMEQYKIAIDILSYSLSKCTPEKIFNMKELSNMQRQLLTLKTWQKVGLLRLLKILRLKRVMFDENSSMIPSELKSEVADDAYLIPPVVFIHFLRFLSYYRMNDLKQCYNSLRDLQLTIKEDYFILDIYDKSVAYDCLGIVVEYLDYYRAGRIPFGQGRDLDTDMNGVLHS